jgi:hypothetical protein
MSLELPITTLTFISTSFTHTLKSPDTLQPLPPLSHRHILFVSTEVGDTQLFTIQHLSRRSKLPSSSYSDLFDIGQTRMVEITGLWVQRVAHVFFGILTTGSYAERVVATGIHDRLANLPHAALQ